jgi:1-acyl-sn-glycerol-3-phosphate acyltransferase
MSGYLDRCWRLLATGFVLIALGLGAIALSVTLFPVLRAISASQDVARLRIQRGMQLTFRFYVNVMRALRLLSIEIEGAERLRVPGQLVIANHPTLLDVVILVSLMPAVDCIVKQALWRNPFLRWPVSWALYIPNRSGEALVAECAAALRRGRALLVFPEGTRTVPGLPLKLRRGVAHIALAAKAPILPVSILVSEPVLTKGFPWYRVPRKRPVFRVVVGQLWPGQDYNSGLGVGPLAARRLTRRIGAYYAGVETSNLQWQKPER